MAKQKVNIDSEGEDEAESYSPEEILDAPIDDTMYHRARDFCSRNRLLRIEKETPSGRLVTYENPALYLEAFAAEEVTRELRETMKRTMRGIERETQTKPTGKGKRR